MKVKINDLPTMAIHFFIAPNKITFCDLDHHTFVTAETEEEFERDFCLDAEAFDLMKKLSTDRKITFQNNQIVIESKEGKFLCAKLNKTLSQIEQIDETNCRYHKKYDIQTLRAARKSVSTQKVRPMLCGVILNSLGEVFATDSVRIYYNEIVNSNEVINSWSVPTNFIDMLTGEQAELFFGKKSVAAVSQVGYKIQSVIYEGIVPNLKKIINAETNMVFEFFKTEQIDLFKSESIILTNKNNELNLKFLNETNEFNLYYPLVNQCQDFTLKIKTDFFVDALKIFEEDKIRIETNYRFIRINNTMIIGCQSH